MNESKYNIGGFLNNFSKKTKNFVVLNSLLKKELNFEEFIKLNEDRYFDFGHGVANMISSASGFSARARTPVVFGYTDLIIGRAYDNLRNDFCLTHSNIKVVGLGGGFDNSLKGGAYQYFEEIAILRGLPNMKIVCPVSLKSFYELFEKSMYEFGPVFFRLNMSLLEEIEVWKIDNSYDYSEDIVVLSYGKIYENCYETLDMFIDDGISVKLFAVEELFPMEFSKFQPLLSAKKIVFIENQNENALFSEFCKALVLSESKANVLYLGMQNKFSESGKSSELCKKNNLDYLSLYRKIKESLL